jgi:hypothetical protein
LNDPRNGQPEFFQDFQNFASVTGFKIKARNYRNAVGAEIRTEKSKKKAGMKIRLRKL